MKDFLFALAARAPDDDRVRALTVSELPGAGSRCNG